MLWSVKKNQDKSKMMLLRRSQYLVVIELILLAACGAVAEDTGKIVGKVMDDRTGEGLQGAKVAVLGTNLEAITDSTGSYEILNAPWRTLTLRASKNGHPEVSVSGVRVIGGFSTRMDFKLGPSVFPDVNFEKVTERKQKQEQPGRIFGIVKDAETGAGLLGADIAIIGGWRTMKVRLATDQEGRFTIENVPVGTYSLEATAIGYEGSVVKGLNVLAGRTTATSLKLKTPTHLER